MLRFRRYRVFLIFAVFTVAALYHFTSVRDWEDARSASGDGLKNIGHKGNTPKVTNEIAEDTPGRAVRVTTLQTPTPLSTSSGVAATSLRLESVAHSRASTSITATSPVQEASTTRQHVPAFTAIPNAPSPTAKIALGPKPDPLAAGGEGRYEPVAPVQHLTPIHWAKQPDHFPVPSGSILQLPTGRPAVLPKIQFAFTDESPSARIDRERKLAAVKSAFQLSWEGYKRPESWLKDELRPVSGGYRNPFCGWAATMVDALDTLWIMGMEDEFQQAVSAVGKIDFTTSIRNDIPLFETTIRYLGGLLSAYDLSGSKNRVLLNKAVELADVLMGAFDTPNRMPVTYYNWKPTYASNPHRASTRTVLAEIGSLSVEFTRLAQLTEEPRYYDAVARITNELEAWQNHTKIPGLWPTHLDASGCEKADNGMDSQLQHSVGNGPHSHGDPSVVNIENPAPEVPSLSMTALQVAAAKGSADSSLSSAATTTKAVGMAPASTVQVPPESEFTKETPALQRRQLAIEALNSTVPEAGTSDTETKEATMKPLPKALQGDQAAPKVDCEPQGLASPRGSTTEDFTFGAMADSVYEYLPKQYMLLGGLVPKYKTMYERAVGAVGKYLMFRPMVPGNRDLLFIASASTTEDPDTPGNLHLVLEQQHLLCFAGGMYAIGSKIFNRPADLESAAKLAEGCVWAYESTTTGIMPEGFRAMRCEDRNDCKWNETRWREELDPYRLQREQKQRNVEEQQAILQAKQEASAAETLKAQEDVAAYEAMHKKQTAADNSSHEVPSATHETDDTIHIPGPVARRQLGQIENVLPSSNLQVSTEPDVPAPAAAKPSSRPVETPYHFPTHEEYVQNRIANERIFPGVTDFTSTKYILRPEAIESVFIMYRVTGDNTWREKGWKMFTAIQNHTKATYGYSAIDDVTAKDPVKLDEMESFWLAETLKYFYLLFSPPDVISLDEYVLNTEAHPFRRPK